MDREPERPQRASLRASDADREQFVERLRQHHVEGRLTADELDERAERAYTARYLGDLDALATDLPPLPPPATAAPGHSADVGPPPRPRPPGPSRAAAKAALYRTVLWFGMVSVLLLVIWATTGADYFWPIWPILGFLIAIGWQVFNLYGPQRFDE